MKQVLENVGDQYCEKDPESLSDETYLSVGNSLKKLNEVKDNLDETFERLSIEFKEKNTNYEPDLFDNIWENMEKKYTIESIYDTITMLFVDMNTIARKNIMKKINKQF